MKNITNNLINEKKTLWVLSRGFNIEMTVLINIVMMSVKIQYDSNINLVFLKSQKVDTQIHVAEYE